MFDYVIKDLKAWGDWKRIPSGDIYHGGSGQTIEYSIMMSKPRKRKKGVKLAVNAYAKKHYCSTCGLPMQKMTCSQHGFDPRAKSLRTFEPKLPKSSNKMAPRHNLEPSPRVAAIDRILTAIMKDGMIFGQYQVAVNKYWLEYTNEEAAAEMKISVSLYRIWANDLHKTIYTALHVAPKVAAA